METFCDIILCTCKHKHARLLVIGQHTKLILYFHDNYYHNGWCVQIYVHVCALIGGAGPVRVPLCVCVCVCVFIHVSDSV